MCPHTQMTQGVSHTIAVAEILRVVTRALAQGEQSLLWRNIITKEHPHTGRKLYQKVRVAREDTRNQDQRSKGQALRMTIYPSHGYARKLIRSLPAFAAAKVERWAMPTWCHMFNSTLTGSARVWFDDLPLESVDSYYNLKEAFLENFHQQKKCIKYPVEIHHIKQREVESMEDFVRRFKVESKDVKGAPEIMRISGFMHRITNPELIKRLHDKIPKSVDEMMRITTSFLRGEVVAGQSGDRIGSLFFQNLQKKFWPWERGKFKAPPPMTTPVKKRNNNKFCEFHGEVGHNTDECMHLKRQIEELLNNGKLSHILYRVDGGDFVKNRGDLWFIVINNPF
ncbi:reverse transcriptase domain-containing protein [Tanacetum coccineum]